MLTQLLYYVWEPKIQRCSLSVVDFPELEILKSLIAEHLL